MKAKLGIAGVLIALSLMYCIGCGAQEVKYDTAGGYQYVPITTVTIVDAKATRLFARTFNDDLSNSIQMYYELRDEKGTSLISGNVTMCCQDYQNWNANDNTSVYTYIANKKHLTFP